MDFPIHTLTSDQGVPIYFEQYPDFFRPISFMLCMMSGGADDMAIGAPGIHHWGEHVPFRGTVLFPYADDQIVARLSELGGYVSAYTTHNQTVYFASAPKSHWREAAEMVVDLAARPLCRHEDIEAERVIIGQEIHQALANTDRRRFYQMRRALWEGHPYGSPVLGTEASLAAATPSTIERMRAHSYGLKRCAVFVAGAIDPDEMRAYVSELLLRMPDNDIEERRMGGDYGALPAWETGKRDVEVTSFDTTVVSMLFPIPSLVSIEVDDEYQLLFELIAAGSMASPLARTVRGERHLAYQTHPVEIMTRRGGAAGFSAKTTVDKVEQVVQAFYDVLALPELRSDERWRYVHARRKAELEMFLPNPAKSTEYMLHQVTDRGLLLLGARARRVLNRPHGIESWPP